MLGRASFVALVGIVGGLLEAGWPRSGARVLWVLVVATTIALVACSAATLRAVSRGRIGHRVGLVASATILLVWGALDRVHFALFQRHVDRSAIRLTFEAVRTHALHVSWADAAFLVCAVALLAIALVALLQICSHIPAPPWVSRIVRRVGVVVVFIGLVFALFQGRLGSADTDAATLVGRLPWADNDDDRPATRSTQSRADLAYALGREADEKTFADLLARRDDLLAGPLAAEKRPSILIVHVESLRFDMLTADLMPNTWKLQGKCAMLPMHYSTGNATGAGIFGLVSGMNAFFYPKARRMHARALPLEVLQRLGYASYMWFGGDLMEFDDIYATLLSGLVTPFHSKNEALEISDRDSIDAYLASVAKTPPNAPRFDYVVLNSSHYKYYYPPEFEHFTPEERLDFGPKGALVDVATWSEQLKPKAQLIKNRYMNSVLYVDTLVERLITGLANQGRFGDMVVVVTGDHGEGFGEHGTFGHGVGLADELTRVPMLFCSEGFKGTRYAQTSHADVLPTIFDMMKLSGVSVPFMTGKSLLAYEPAQDVAITSDGVTGDQEKVRFVAVASGVKVFFYNTERLDVFRVWRNDEETKPAPGVVADVMMKAIGQKQFR